MPNSIINLHFRGKDMRKNAYVICDLQWGSCGKGSAAGYLAMKHEPDLCITAWSPNAGHTFIDTNGRKFIHCALANGIVSPKLKAVALAPGSVINLDTLAKELEECRDIMQNKTLFIHENAAIVRKHHRDEEEATMTGIGSTKKGSGAALMEKLRRNVVNSITAGSCEYEIYDRLLDEHLVADVHIVNTKDWTSMINEADMIQIEGAQGFSLGVNSGFYPYCTSRECTPAQILSDCLVPFQRVAKVVGVMRTFPIRVANRYNEEGEMIGWSGPCYPDQKEISWENLGKTPEMTTVTKLKRRVFTFSKEQTMQGMLVCAPDEIFLSFCDYLPIDAAYQLAKKINSMAERYIGLHSQVKYMAWGPSIDDVRDMGSRI